MTHNAEKYIVGRIHAQREWKKKKPRTIQPKPNVADWNKFSSDSFCIHYKKQFSFFKYTKLSRIFESLNMPNFRKKKKPKMFYWTALIFPRFHSKQTSCSMLISIRESSFAIKIESLAKISQEKKKYSPCVYIIWIML